mmetsp:Transcript_7864/g.19336  ORF Transcript_7864/g.19336 Transcript_7864/m.19336 type:complete len:216 (+) Transcript_7864:1627-2274(+)
MAVPRNGQEDQQLKQKAFNRSTQHHQQARVKGTEARHRRLRDAPTRPPGRSDNNCLSGSVCLSGCIYDVRTHTHTVALHARIASIGSTKGKHTNKHANNTIEPNSHSPTNQDTQKTGNKNTTSSAIYLVRRQKESRHTHDMTRTTCREAISQSIKIATHAFHQVCCVMRRVSPFLVFPFLPTKKTSSHPPHPISSLRCSCTHITWRHTCTHGRVH